jgi:predicted MFS family arabinose efflux permease
VDELLALSTLASQRAFLWLCVIVGTLAVLGAVRWLPRPAAESPAVDDRKLPFRRPVVTTQFPFLPARLYWRLQRLSPKKFVDRFTPTLATYYLAISLFFTGFGVFFAPLPAYLASAGYASEHIFLLFLFAALGSAMAYGSAGDLVSRHDTTDLQAGALGVRAAALPAVALVHLWGFPLRFAVVAVLFVVIGVSWAVIVTGAMTHIADLTPASIRGEALGVYKALSALAGGIGSLTGGYLASASGYVATFVLACVVVLASTVVILRPERVRLSD